MMIEIIIILTIKKVIIVKAIQQNTYNENDAVEDDNGEIGDVNDVFGKEV